jgi:putative FmdB family regulatory protein
MPIYEYQCQTCGRRSEELQKMADAPLTECKVCGGPLKRLVSSPAVQFKGSGWYVTDYARKSGGGSSPGKGEGEGASTAESKGGETKGSGATSEAKPAADSKAASSATSGTSSGASGGSGGSGSSSGSSGSSSGSSGS